MSIAEEIRLEGKLEMLKEAVMDRADAPSFWQDRYSPALDSATILDSLRVLRKDLFSELEGHLAT